MKLFKAIGDVVDANCKYRHFTMFDGGLVNTPQHGITRTS